MLYERALRYAQMLNSQKPEEFDFVLEPTALSGDFKIVLRSFRTMTGRIIDFKTAIPDSVIEGPPDDLENALEDLYKIHNTRWIFPLAQVVKNEFK